MDAHIGHGQSVAAGTSALHSSHLDAAGAPGAARIVVEEGHVRAARTRRVPWRAGM
jgi:hypothetical protein